MTQIGIKNLKIFMTAVFVLALIFQSHKDLYASDNILNCPIGDGVNPKKERHLYKLVYTDDGGVEIYEKLIGFEDELGKPKWKASCSKGEKIIQDSYGSYRVITENFFIKNSAEHFFECKIQLFNRTLFGLYEKQFSHSKIVWDFYKLEVRDYDIDIENGIVLLEKKLHCTQGND